MAVKDRGRDATGRSDRSQRLAPYFERLEPAHEFEYSSGRHGEPTFEVRVFDDRDETGEVKVQFWQVGRRRKAAVLTDDSTGGELLDELISDLVSARDALAS